GVRPSSASSRTTCSRASRAIPTRPASAASAAAGACAACRGGKGEHMPVNLAAPRAEELHAVRGLRIGIAEAGIRKANRKDLTVSASQVLPFSTGVIMEPLPIERIEAGLPAAIADAKEANWLRAAEGIMTTDTLPKAFSRQVQVGGETVTITGIGKGAGMIRP